MNREFRKYLLYAFGEMALVIVGILIALQIDNWNTERKEKATLASYLQSIARNVREDLDEIESLRDTHWQRIFTAMRAEQFVLPLETFEVEDVAFFTTALWSAQGSTYFNPNLSGYEALKSSGVLDRLQGSDVERLLSDYYDTVSRIGHSERDHNEYVRSLSIQLATAWPSEVEGFVFSNPSALPAERFEALQPVYRNFIGSNIPSQLIAAAVFSGSLLRKFDRLSELGELFLSMTAAGAMDFEAAPPGTTLPEAADARAGEPALIVNGKVPLQDYIVLWSQAFDSDWKTGARTLELSEDSTRVDYPGGTEWAALYLMPFVAEAGRPSRDFAGFSRLSLEMKGDRGGERLWVHVKDSDDPDDEPPASVEVTLTDDWQTYTFNLDAFAPTDFSILHVPLGFLFAEEPVAFSVREARYLDDD